LAVNGGGTVGGALSLSLSELYEALNWNYVRLSPCEAL